MSRVRATCTATAAAGLLAACAGGPALPGLPSAADFSTGGLPQMATFAIGADRVVGTPTEVYTRVARGALTCWFGAAGGLKKSYIYHANAEPPSKGGSSEIIIYARDNAAADPRSQKAYEVEIATVDGHTKVDVQNVKMPEPLAQHMGADVARWAANEEGCGEGPITGGWSAQETVAPAAKTTRKGVQPVASR